MPARVPSSEEALKQLLQHMRQQPDYESEEMENDGYPQYYLPNDYPLMERVRKGAGNCYAQGKCLYYSKRLKTEFCGNCGTRQKCFPQEATVSLESGVRVPMTGIKIGDRVMAGVRSSGELVYSSVVAWLDRRANTTAQYTRVTTKSGHSLVMSPNHVTFIKNNKNRQLISKFASDLNKGDLLLTVDKEIKSELVWSAIESIHAVISTGAYVPLTSEGTIVVDGVLASCYASFDHDWSHALSSPLRWFPSFFTGLTEDIDGPRDSVEQLKLVGHWLFPERGTTHRAGPDRSIIELPMSISKQLAEQL